MLSVVDQNFCSPQILGDPEANKYIAGIGIHWYLDTFLPASLITDAHNLFPNKFIFATEACEGSLPWQKDVPVDLGSWTRGAVYASDIIDVRNKSSSIEIAV